MCYHSIFHGLALAAALVSCGADWPQYHGPAGTSIANSTGLPREFGPRQNCAWTVDLPGPGPASPIVVGGRVVVTCATGASQDRLHVLCFDAADGKRLWQRQLWATGHTLCHPFGGVAIPTPASDGRQIVVFYSSNDMACFDRDGNLLWYRGLGMECPTTRNDVGMASSPRIVGDVVVVQLENQGESFAAGIDMADGRTRWRVDREHGATWTSPIALPGKTAADDAVLLQSRSCLTAHDPRTGKELWRYPAEVHTVATLTVCGDTVYLPADNSLTALRFDPASHEVKVLWKEPRLRLENGSPIVHGGRVYAVKSPGILVCGEAATGNLLGHVRLKGPIWATPVLADGHLYVVNHEGLVQVVSAEDSPRLVAGNQLDKNVLASPAVAGGALYFRSQTKLWKIAR